MDETCPICTGGGGGGGGGGRPKIRSMAGLLLPGRQVPPPGALSRAKGPILDPGSAGRPDTAGAGQETTSHASLATWKEYIDGAADAAREREKERQRVAAQAWGKAGVTRGLLAYRGPNEQNWSYYRLEKVSCACNAHDAALSCLHGVHAVRD